MYDVLSLGRFVSGTLWLKTLCPWDVLSRDVFSVHPFRTSQKYTYTVNENCVLQHLEVRGGTLKPSAARLV